jgi:hypothetical protein
MMIDYLTSAQELEDDPTFGDTGYGSNASIPSKAGADRCSSASLTGSLSPSVMDYPFERGRRYHAYRPGSKYIATYLSSGWCRLHG